MGQKLPTFLFTALLTITLAACSSSPSAPTGPTSVTLAPGQSTVVSGLSVKFVGVTLDTRCPADALCIQMGDAFVALETVMLGGRRAFELQLLNPTNRSTTHGSYSIELTELTPYPFAGQPIAPGDYRAKLTVARDIAPAKAQ